MSSGMDARSWSWAATAATYLMQRELQLKLKIADVLPKLPTFGTKVVCQFSNEESRASWTERGVSGSYLGPVQNGTKTSWVRLSDGVTKMCGSLSTVEGDDEPSEEVRKALEASGLTLLRDPEGRIMY